MTDSSIQEKKSKEPVPIGPSRELEALLPQASTVVVKERHRQPHRRRSLVILLTLLILAVLSLYHHRRYSPATKTSKTTAGVSSSRNSSSAPPTPLPARSKATTTNGNKSDSPTSQGEAAAFQEQSAPREIPSKSNTTTTTSSTAYKIQWGAFHPCLFPFCMVDGSATSGCTLGTGPAIHISCGGMLTYVNQSNCFLERTGTRASLYCQGTWSFVDTVHVTCAGTKHAALPIEVQLDMHSYRCNQVLNEHRTWNGPVYERGGAVGHHVSISVQTHGSDDTVQWSEVASDSRTATCSTQTTCMDTYLSCQGAEACLATVPYLVTSVSSQDAHAAAVVLP